MKTNSLNIYRWIRGVGNFTNLVLVLLLVIPLVILITTFITTPTKVFAATTTVNLLTTDNFAVLAHTSITDIPTSSISGDVGLTAGASITGLQCSEVTGTIYDSDSGYTGACRVTDGPRLTQAETDLTTASTDAAGRTATPISGGDNQLGGTTLTSGVYSFGHATTANLTGTLTLDGQGDSNAVFIFQASSDLVTASSSVVSLINSAQACNVFWVVSDQATLGSSSTFIGTIMAGTSVVMNTSATLNGRALAHSAAVTLDHNTITKPTCTSPTPTPTSSSSSSSTSSSSSSSSDSTCVAPEIIYAPTIVESTRISPTSIYLKWTQADSGLNSYIVQYGPENNNWSYNTIVQGLSTTLSNLPPNQPIWAKVAATAICGVVGNYGEAKLLVGQGQIGGVNSNVLGVSFPNTGFAPLKSNIPWYIPAGIFVGISALLCLIQRKHRCSSGD